MIVFVPVTLVEYDKDTKAYASQKTSINLTHVMELRPSDQEEYATDVIMVGARQSLRILETSKEIFDLVGNMSHGTFERS